MLIDFADILQTNVYVLGGVFLQLCRLLRLEQHPLMQKPIDPSLFIHRFAGQVELGTTDAHRGEHGAAARGVHEAGLDADWSSSEWNLWCRVVGRRSNSWIQSEQARCRGPWCTSANRR